MESEQDGSSVRCRRVCRLQQQRSPLSFGAARKKMRLRHGKLGKRRLSCCAASCYPRMEQIAGGCRLNHAMSEVRARCDALLLISVRARSNLGSCAFRVCHATVRAMASLLSLGRSYCGVCVWERGGSTLLTSRSCMCASTRRSSRSTRLCPCSTRYLLSA